MTPPSFWWQPEVSLQARLLSPVGAAVGAVTVRRMGRAPAFTASVPVICIGNPTVGGAGKTPVAIAAARLLKAAGASPVFLTRGYRGREPGPTVVTGQNAADVGDEAILLAAVAPTVVARDRAAGGAIAAGLGDVIVMDDGFQNPGLAKTVALLVIDRSAGLGNACIFPAGPMRANLKAHLAHADGVVLVAGHERAEASLPGFGAVPVFAAMLEVSTSMSLEGVDVVAFAGVGRPSKFFASVARLGARIAAAIPFPDHHSYRSADSVRLLALAQKFRARLVTTAKDHVRLNGPVLAELAGAAQVIAVDAGLDRELSARLVDVWRTYR